VVIFVGKPVRIAIFDAFVAVIPVELFEEFKRLFGILEIRSVETMNVEVGDERAVKMQVVVKPLREDGDFYAISGTFEPPEGFPARLVLFSALLDISSCQVLYSLTMGGDKTGARMHLLPTKQKTNFLSSVQSQRCSEFSGIRYMSPVFESWPLP